VDGQLELSRERRDGVQFRRRPFDFFRLLRIELKIALVVLKGRFAVVRVRLDVIDEVLHFAEEELQQK